MLSLFKKLFGKKSTGSTDTWPFPTGQTEANLPVTTPADPVPDPIPKPKKARQAKNTLGTKPAADARKPRKPKAH